MDIEQYIISWLEAEDDLRAHKKVDVIECNIDQNDYEKTLLENLSKLQLNISQDIIDFYKYLNGIQLCWIHKDHPNYSSAISESITYHFEPQEFVFESFVCSGYVNILPFEEVFFTQWDELKQLSTLRKPVNFNGKNIPASDFYNSIYPFDVFGLYHTSAFFLDSSSKEVWVIFSFGDFKDFSESVITDFESYLFMILYKRGLLKARKKYYQHGKVQRLIKTPANIWSIRDIPNLDTYQNT
ncbi:hypothetical protein [uncultured Microscilla sp.]|uniref:hypothetical protein n=1 Tax=uncultured Microscilla sp. TaxID=432653 RepID=UPI0026310260|nr:hypothetical protein [uncultured Microscilla sp.]